MSDIDIKFFYRERDRRAEVCINGETWSSIRVSQEIPWNGETIDPCEVNWSAWGDVGLESAQTFAEGLKSAVDIATRWNQDIGRAKFSEIEGEANDRID